jgi:hypothetical protein
LLSDVSSVSFGFYLNSCIVGCVWRGLALIGVALRYCCFPPWRSCLIIGRTYAALAKDISVALRFLYVIDLCGWRNVIVGSTVIILVGLCLWVVAVAVADIGIVIRIDVRPNNRNGLNILVLILPFGWRLLSGDIVGILDI